MTEDTSMRVKPVQGRAKERVEQIRAAARQHYSEVGRDQFNFDAVASIAGCSVPTLYRYYTDRVALMDDAVPERDAAEKTLASIRGIKRMHISRAEKWQRVERLLDL